MPLLPPIALPSNGKVVAGSAVISQTQTATSASMTVNQTSQRAVVNWDSFNVGKNATVSFNQPNASAVTLNRVTGTTASMIEGAVKANGQVIFVNPNGVTFSKGAEINAGGVVATTMDIANKDFMEGKSTYKGNNKGAVINEGKITTTTDGGYIALLAPEVRNDGYLLAKKGSGTVALASGELITLDFKGNSLISVKVDVATYNGLIENKRVVEVNGGLVVIAAGSANQLMAGVIKNTGRISASSLVNNGGVIELVANTVTQAGKVLANGKGADSQGGQVNIVGNDITIAQNSKTTATGSAAGGQVNIGLANTQVSGGTQVNTQASNPTQAAQVAKANADTASNNKQLARTVNIEQGALIDTSATQSGNGGSIAIWSEVKTTVAGILKSMGGALSGNGGFIETSSKGAVALISTATINTSANNQTGKSGSWLLDPIDLTIDSAAANVISAALANNNVTIEVNANTTACPSLGGCTQNGTGSLTIASGADILKAGGNMTTLTLSSSGIFNLNANISGQNLNVIINSSIAYLNVGSSVTASEVTVQAQTIYAAGNIQTSPYSLANNSSSLGNAIKLLAQAIYVSGGLSLNANLPSNSAQIVTVGGVAKRSDELPSYLIAQNNNQSGNLNQVYSVTAANDANSLQVTPAQSNVIYLTASNQLSINSTAQVLANGTTGGSIYAQAPVINTQAGSVVQANGNNGPGGLIAFSGDQITVAGNIAANGSTDGGSITLIANYGDLTINNSTIQTNGSNGRGGSIGISTINHLAITSSAIEATGYTQGGKILIGNDAKNGTLPFALSANIDQYSSINVAQLDQNSSNQNGGFIETSGQILSMMASINAGRGGMWLIDPTNVTISTTAGTSTGTDPLLFTNQTNISASQIQTAINSGISVQIIADGTITQTANLSFSIASGSSASLTLDNSSGTAQAITLTGTTTNTGAGDLNLNYISNGQIKINGAINSTSTGKINVVAKTSYATNTLTTCSAGACASIYNGASGSITTKGGYVVMDATGGSVSGTTITIGSIQNGPIYLNAAINTTTAGTSASGAGGHFSLAASANQASGIGSFEPNVATLNIGGNATFSLKNYTNASYGFVVASYASTSPITAYGNIDITSIGVSNTNYGLIYVTSALTSTAGNITLTATSTNTSATLNPGVSSNASGTLTANAGAITVTSTSNASTAVSLLGAMSAKSISITGTSTTAATIVSLGAMTIVAGGSDLSVTAKNTTGGANTGITQTGAITVNANGGNISFISNNIISQSGAISLAANTSGTASTVLYDTTTGAKTSNITAGALTVSSGSSSAINYIIKTSGAGIDTGALSVPGSVLLDNTYGGTGGVGGTPTSGYITTANSATFAGASIGVLVNAAITAGTGITLKGASFTGWYSVTLQAAISTSTGSISITGTGIDYAVHGNSAGTILATAGAVTITGTSTSGQAVQLAGAITAHTGITISATGTTAATIVTLGAMTLGYGYYSGDNTNPNVISSLSGTSGSLLGAFSGSALPVISSASLTGGSIGGDGTYSATAAILESSNSSSSTYVIGYSNGVHTKMVRLVITASDGYLYATETLARYSTTQLNSTGGSNILGGTTNLSSIWSGTTTAMTLAASSTAAGYAAANIVLSGSGYTPNTASGNITVTANNTAGGGNTGITTSGIITNNASGSNITFTSNNLISQTGAISLVANTSSNAANVTYDTTAGTKASTITTGSLTIASGSTSDINLVIKSAGSAINPNLIGTTSSRLPGTVTIDNTYGGSTPASGYVTTSNLSTVATASAGVLINNAIYSTKLITIKGISYTAQGINYSAVINASTGGVDITGTTYNNYGVYTSNASLITGDFITIIGRAPVAVAGWITQIGALTINSGSTGGDITVSATGSSAGSDNGINQTGAISAANGSDITFTANNILNQTGAITIAANTSGNTATVTYDTTPGNKSSTITTGSLAITAGSSSDINLVLKSAGSAINPNLIGTSSSRLPGTVTIDNTYGGGTPASGFITTSNLSTAATASAGVTINNAIYSTKLVSIKGISYTSQGVNYSSVMNSSTGGVEITGTTYNNYGIYTGNASLITGDFITINGRGAVAVAGWIAQIGALTINSGSAGGDITVTATGTSAGTDNGISQSGAIAVVSGSDITFTSNNKISSTGTIEGGNGTNISFAANGAISQTGTITMAANTSGNVATLTYNTTGGTKASTIVSGTLNLTAGSTSDINFVMLSSGSAINPGVIGSSSVRLPGTITLDNTYGGATPATGYVTSSNISTAATASPGVTINNALHSTKLISIKGISYTSQGINYSATINSSAGGVELTGTTYNNYGVYTASSLITGNFITLTARASVAATYVAYLGPMTINSGSTGGDITITSTGTTAGSDAGITQIGAISAANGSDISFIANNIIDQRGAISMAANTNAISTITYDTTGGNRLSTITAGVVTTTAGSTYAINYLVKSSGSAITVNDVSVPGYINIDNTYGSASGAKSSGYFNGTNNTTSNVTGSAGVLVSGVLTAGGALTIKGVSASSWGIQNSSAYTLTAGAGDLTLVGVGVHGIYQMGSLIATAGNISASAYALSGVWAYYAQSGVQKNYIASGNIDLVGYSTTYSSAINIHNILMRTTSGDITLSARGGATGNGAVHPAIYLVTSVINAGDSFVIQGATNTGGIATAAPGTASLNTMADTGVHIASSASWAYGGTTYTGYKAAGDISIAGSSTGSYAIYNVAAIESTAGSVSITGTSTTGYGIRTLSGGTITGYTGVALYGVGAAGSITTAALVRNTGTTGGLVINAVANASIGAVTNSGADGIRITGGNGVAAGTTTGGTIIALGTVTNTGGVVALSMAAPRTANSYDVEGAVGITSSNASTSNVRYSVQGGSFTTPTTYTSGNYIDYRSGTTSYTITVSLGANYSAAYGTAYTDSSALTWLRSNATVTLSATPFGVSTAGIKDGLVWNSTIGSAGINANAVQAGTTIVSANISAGTGQSVTLSGTSRTYTITAKALTITNLASTSSYDASTTYASLVNTAGYSVSGLVTSIGGIAVTDAVTSVTQTMKSGSVVGSGSVVSGVAQNGSFNTVPSAAVGVGLSNYIITYVGVASTVNKATLTITAAADTKVYGNTTTGAGIVYSAGASSATGGVGYSITSGSLFGSDTLTGVTLTSTGGAATTAVGTGISIVPSAASGSGIGNYTITYANGAMAVTARPLTITASTQNTNYGTSYALGTSAFTTSGLVNTDAVSSATLKYNGATTVAGTTNAGTYTGGIIASAASGTGLSNYSISYVAGNLVVATKALTITASTQNSTYGTAYALGSSAFTTSGLVNSDSVTSTTLLYSGNATVSPTVNAATYSAGIVPSAATGVGLSNYSISYVAGNLVVGKATLTLTPNGASVTYDASTLNNSTYSQLVTNYAATGYKNTDVAASVPVALSGSMAFNGSATTVVKNAATYALTVGTLAGTTTNGNYQIAFANPSSNAYVINPATVSVSASKDYDGSRSFSANQITVLTGIGTQTLTLSGTANANSANVTSVSSLATTGLTLGNGTNGGLAGNYVLPASTSSVVINPLSITASVAGTPSKQYDATTAATLTSVNFSLSGFIAGEGATVTQTIGTYNSANASTNTGYSPASTITASLVPSHFTADSGTLLSNYILPTNASGAGVITTAPLTVSANSYSAFSGQAPASFTGSVTGAMGSDAITVSVTQSSTATGGVYTLTPAAVMSTALSGNYGTPTVVTGTYTEAQQYQLVVTAANSSSAYGSITSSSSANTPVNLVAQYCTVSSNCTSGTIITLSLTAPSATVSQITTSSVTTPTWVATDSASNTYNLKVISDATLGFSTGNYLNAGTYTFMPSGSTNATISGTTLPVIYIPGAASVTPISVIATNNSAPTKVYDATTALTNGLSLAASNKLTGDALSLTGAGVYSSKNVGTTNYTITSVSLSGADAANYRYTAGNIAGTNGSITPAPITISGLAAANKIYDAGLTAVVSGTPTAVGVLGLDTATVSGSATTGTFASANVAAGIVVTPVLSGLSLSNSNYSISGVTTTLAANITAAPVTATITRAYDGTTSVANANIAITGVAGQTLTLATGTATLTNPNVGSAGLSSLNGATLSDGTGLASNYTLISPTGVVTITPAAISITASNAVKVYDATTSVTDASTAPAATLSTGTLFTNSATGDVDTLSGGSFSYASSGAGSGNKTLSVSGVGILNGSNNAAANYTITYVDNTTSTITPAPITISGLTASNKQYDTGLSAVVAGTPTAVGTIGADSITISGSATTGSFASANVGTGIVVTPVLSGLSLSNANYQITGVASPLTANITVAPITISGISAANKVYDTGTAATISGTPVANGALGSDVVTVTGSVTAGTFASANVGTGIAVTPTISGLSLSNSNYEITGISNLIAANITAAPVTVTADNQSTTYGTPLSLGTASFTVSGLLGSDAISSVTLAQQGNTTVPGTQNAGTYTGSVNGILPSAASGTNLSNYQITYSPGTLTIARKAINVIANNASMIYADTTLPTLSFQTVAGLVNGDQMSGALATSATPWTTAGSASNVGSYYITQGTVTAGSNYDITYTRASLTVNPANLYVTAENQVSTYGSLLVLPQSGTSAYSVAGLRNDDSASSATVLYSGNQTIPATTNAGLYAGSIDVSALNGIRLSNYNITYTPGDLTVAKALLTVTAADSAKFVGTSDPSGFSGVMYSGFKNSDSSTSGALGLAVVSVSRSNSSENNAGVYSDVLVPNVSTSLQNYTVGYVNGKFTIVGANQLLVQVGSNATVYGTPASYSAGAMTVSYCTDCALGNASPSIVSITGADITASGSAVTVVTGNTTGAFTISPVNPTMNAAGTQIGVGSYGLRATATEITTSPPGGTPNFNQVYVVGGLTVTPLQLTYADLGIAGVTQVYNGSVNMTNLGITATSGILPGDTVSIAASGTYASKNVGINIPYTVAIALSGVDAANYQINNSMPLSGTNGVITQLNSVTYTGPTSGGSWANPSNWTTTGTTNVGAIPDLSNVANVILPSGYSVIYDDSVQGPVTSAVSNSGNLNFNLSSAATIGMPISGVGSVTISGVGAITLTGDSSFTGGINLGASNTLIAGSNNALGSGLINSSGTAASPANFSTSSGITMPALNIVGGTTAILSDINTAGAQSYSGSLIIGTSGTGTTTLQSSNANILLDATINGAVNKTESLVINAGTGVVTLGNSIGETARLNNLTVTGSQIYILADIVTGIAQTYNGAVYIGDASYLGRTPTVGFLFTDNYRGYFQYVAGTGIRASTISYLDLNPIYVRTMISEDPSITYNGTVNDTVANTHTLLIAAIAPAVIPYGSGYAAVNAGASINFNAAVGATAPLYSLNAQTVVSNTQANASTTYIGTVSLVDSVRTYSNQTYRANLMSAQSSAAPNSVTFSVWDPAATVSFNLPEQSLANSGCSSNCGQYNLQNPGSLDRLTINGISNFMLDANVTGVNNWGDQITSNQALGYIASTPSAAPPIRVTTISADSVGGGALREAIKYHVDQVQMEVDVRNLIAAVTVSAPEAIALAKSVGTNLLKAGDAHVICSVDAKGDLFCGED